MTETQAAAAAAPPTAPATDRTGHAWAGRAVDVGVRIGGLAIAILIVIAIFTALSKPNTFLSVHQCARDHALHEHHRHRGARV